jgi:hypothetical protein
MKINYVYKTTIILSGHKLQLHFENQGDTGQILA